MFNKFRKMAIEKRLEDQFLFEFVLDELESGTKIKGLWAKAYANAEGDSNKVEPLYMQYRVQSIKDFFTSMKIAYEELSKDTIADYIKNSKNQKEPQVEQSLFTEEKNLKKNQNEKSEKSAFEIAREEYLNDYEKRQDFLQSTKKSAYDEDRIVTFSQEKSSISSQKKQISPLKNQSNQALQGLFTLTIILFAVFLIVKIFI